jgi:hypothetical protein
MPWELRGGHELLPLELMPQELRQGQELLPLKLIMQLELRQLEPKHSKMARLQLMLCWKLR